MGAEAGVSGALGVFGPVALGAWEVEDDLGLLVGGIEFAVNGGEGAEEQVTGVGQDGGAAGSDFVASLELIEFAERVVDVGGGAEFLDVPDERRGQVGLIQFFLAFGGVLAAEPECGSETGMRQRRPLAVRY